MRLSCFDFKIRKFVEGNCKTLFVCMCVFFQYMYMCVYIYIYIKGYVLIEQKCVHWMKRCLLTKNVSINWKCAYWMKKVFIDKKCVY